MSLTARKDVNSRCFSGGTFHRTFCPAAAKSLFPSIKKAVTVRAMCRQRRTEQEPRDSLKNAFGEPDRSSTVKIEWD
jgi:hypothetical protein